MAMNKMKHSEQCFMPVMEYTTGDPEADQWLYSDSVAWVVEDVFLYPQNVPREQLEGWVVLIRMVADGDHELDSLTLLEDEQAQVMFDGTWIPQDDFEHYMCTKTF